MSESPLAGTGPDLELPMPEPAPSTFTPVAAENGSDRGDHHYRIISHELDSLQSRINHLRATARFLDQSATVAFIRRFTVRA